MLSGSNKDEKSHNRGWFAATDDPVYGTYRAEKSRENPWTYRSKWGMQDHKFTAGLYRYPKGGYFRSLGTTLQEARIAIQYLQDNLWIDSYTRAVFLEFTAYNNNNNFYCIVTLVLECTADGGVVPFSRIVSTRLDRYHSQFALFLAVCEISFIFLSFYSMWLELKKFEQKGLSYLREAGNLIELLIFTMTWATFGLLIIRLGVVKWTKNEYKKDRDDFTSFQYAATCDLFYGYAMAAVVVLAYLKILKVLRFNKSMLPVLKILQYAAKDLKYYMIFFCIALMAFISWANLTFGRGTYRYSTYLRSLMSILDLTLGSSQYVELQSANRLVAPVFLIMCVVSLNFVLFNLLLTVILDAFAAAKEKFHRNPTERDSLQIFIEFQENLPFLVKKLRVREPSDERVMQYYQQREAQKKGLLPTADGQNALSNVTKDIDKMDDILNVLLLSEYEEIDEIAGFAIRLKRKEL